MGVMSKQDGSCQLTEINVTTHSISTSPGSSQDDYDKLLLHLSYDTSECGMVSEITTITRAAHKGSCSWDRFRIRVVLAISFLIVVYLLAVVILRENGTADDGADAPDPHTPMDYVGRRRPLAKIVEFTVTNLNTKAIDCTQVDNELQCVHFLTNSTNKFRIRLRPEWAPLGVERFEQLTASGFWQGVRVFRIVPNFVSQFGISSQPEDQRDWLDAGAISDDPVVASNRRGTVTFATSGPDTRTTQVFINTNDNWYLNGEIAKT